MSSPEKLTFGQTYVVQSDGPIKITQTGAHGTLVKVNVTDAAGTNGREVVFTAIDTAATVEVDEGTNWSCVPGFNRGAASVQGGPESAEFMKWVTDGKLTFDADGRLKIATSVDATGTFNHDGYASNYTKVVEGVRYTTTVNATEVIVKKSVGGVETVLMHLKDGVLELGGERVLTARARETQLMQNGVNRFSFKTWQEVHDYFEQFYVGDTFVCDAPWLGAGGSSSTGYDMFFPLAWRGGDTPFQRRGNDMIVKPKDGTRRFVLRFNGYPNGGGGRFFPAKDDCDFVFIITGNVGFTTRDEESIAAKTLTVIMTYVGTASTVPLYLHTRMFGDDGKFIGKFDGLSTFPTVTADQTWFQGSKGADQDYSFRCEVSLNNLASSFHLFDGTNGTTFALTADSVAYTLNSLKTVTNAPTAHFGIDDRCIRAVGEGETADYEYRDGEDGTWGSGSLATAVAGAKSRGWLMNPVIVNVTTGPVA